MNLQRMINSGIIERRTEWDINSINLEAWIITRKTGRPMVPFKNNLADYITIHETANTTATADAESHGRYIAKEIGYAWHVTVDEDSCIQHLPWTEQGWHAGDGNGDGNAKSIGVEMCVNEGADIKATRLRAARLVAYLIKEGHGKKGIVQHNYWTRKNCPTMLRRERGWHAFLREVNRQLAGTNYIVDKGKIGTVRIKENTVATLKPELRQTVENISDSLQRIASPKFAGELINKMDIHNRQFHTILAIRVDNVKRGDLLLVGSQFQGSINKKFSLFRNAPNTMVTSWLTVNKAMVHAQRTLIEEIDENSGENVDTKIHHKPLKNFGTWVANADYDKLYICCVGRAASSRSKKGDYVKIDRDYGRLWCLKFKADS